MSLNFAIQNATSGLNATSRQAEVTANNVANANTEGYDRREAQLAAQVLAGKGAGVRVLSVERATAEAITADRRRVDAEVGEQNELASAANRLAQIVGGPDDPASLHQSFVDLETSLRELTNTPESTLSKNGVLTAAQDLATMFNTIDAQLIDLRKSADKAIAAQVDTVNAALEEVRTLNKQISRGVGVGADTTEYEAQRDDLIDTISDIVPIVTLPQDDGQMYLATTTGAMMLTSNAATFEFTEAGTITAAMDYRAGAPGSLDGLSLNGGDITPSTTGVQSISSGSLRGLFEVRDVLTVEFQSQIDALAEDLITRFTAAEPATTVPAGSAGLFTDNQTASTGTAGLAGRLQVNDLVIPPGGSLDGLSQGIYVVGTPVAGDNAQEIALLEAMTAEAAAPVASGVSGTHSATDVAAEFGSLVSSDAVGEEQRLTVKSAQQVALEQTEAAATGVDIDYELQNLTLIQTAYAANARVLQVVDQMLQTLLEI